MKIEKDRVVRFHYTLFESSVSESTVSESSASEGNISGQNGQPLESSRDREPLSILIGHGNIIPGLEQAMDGHEAGDRFGADVAAAQAYGEKREGMSQRVSKKLFGSRRLAPGMQVMVNTDYGQRAVTIRKVGVSVVDVDLNHPMAGKDLHFDIEVIEVREASKEELEHGHVHGAGGHQH